MTPEIKERNSTEDGWCYWAEFIADTDNNNFRFNTRIYLCPIDHICPEDYCIGAIVGKNPGSAKANNKKSGIRPININGDKLLPTVKNIVTKAYTKANIEPKKGEYIQVLNLFYLCDPNLSNAITRIENKPTEYCSSENESFPWIWYVWGGKSPALDVYKKRFSSLKTQNHFYYDKNYHDQGKGEIVKKQPTLSSFAKHTQGLKHSNIVPHITELIKYQEILELIDEKNIICPLPGEWDTLYKILPDQKRVGSSWHPNLPLILSAWDHTPLLLKIIRFNEHLDYALEKGVIDQVRQYLFSLKDNQFLVSK